MLNFLREYIFSFLLGRYFGMEFSLPLTLVLCPLDQDLVTSSPWTLQWPYSSGFLGEFWSSPVAELGLYANCLPS